MLTLLFGQMGQPTVTALLTWFRSGSLSAVLNGLDKIELSFTSSFQAVIDTAKLSNNLLKLFLIYFLAPTIFMFVTASQQFFVAKNPTLHDLLTLGIRYIGICVFGVGTYTNLLLFYAICSIMTLIYTQIYSQMLAGSYKSCVPTTKFISNWKSILLVMEDQLKIISEWFSPVESVSFFLRVVNISTSLYTILSNFANSHENQSGSLTTSSEQIQAYFVSESTLSFIATLTTVMLFSHLLIGVIYAERIYKAVRNAKNNIFQILLIQF